jgi:hypothetical protein
MEIKKVIRDGQVAVIVAKGWGAGFTTWTSDWDPEDKNCLQQLFDPELVDMCEKLKITSDQRERIEFIYHMEDYIDEKYPKAFAEVEHLEVEWVPEGSLFRINEYDGYETIEFFKDTKWIKA